MNIALVGNICVGKSTLASAMDDEYRRRHISSIVVKEKRNEEVMSYYASGLKEDGQSEHALEVEMRTLADRCMDHRKAEKSPVDRKIFDRWLWCNRVFAGVSMPSWERVLFDAVFEQMLSKIELPDIIFYLKTSPDILYESNRLRSLRDSRESERGLPKKYFELIQSSYDKEIELLKKKLPELTIIIVDWSEYGSARDLCDVAEEFFETGELKPNNKMYVY